MLLITSPAAAKICEDEEEKMSVISTRNSSTRTVLDIKKLNLDKIFTTFQSQLYFHSPEAKKPAETAQVFLIIFTHFDQNASP